MINVGQYKAGQFEQSPTGYKHFFPSRINDFWTWDDPQINSLLEKAAIRLGELNSFSKLVPNVELFIQLHIAKEAVVSSRIEGTQTNIDEALLKEDEISIERRQDWKEVNNYIKALNNAIAELEDLPISSRLIRRTHEILLDSVRGEHKQPGDYRTSQNWIGGSGPTNAVFVPPHHNYLHDLMGDLENFIHNDEISVPALIKIAIVHYQFETIHPFLDGNGRIGRLLITLFLVEQRILTKPLLYLSVYFEKNKSLYYDNFTSVRTKNDMAQWLKYFLTGICETAEQACTRLSRILELKSELEIKLNNTFGRKGNSAIKLLTHLFKNPVVYVNQVRDITGLTYKASNDLVSDFIAASILKEQTGQQRNRIFIFHEYIDLFG